MDRRAIEAEFFDIYGFRGDEEELSEFAADRNYHFDSYYGYEQLRYYPPGGSGGFRRPESVSGDSGDAGNAKGEFSALFKEILGQVRRHKHSGQSQIDHDLMAEFGCLMALFLLKFATYYVLRICEEKDYCTTL